VDLALEGIERDLPHHGVDHVLDLAGEQRLALPGPWFPFSSAEGQHLAEHAAVSASVSGVGAISAPFGRRQHLMHAVAEFMRQRHHIARLAEVVHST
jgi:hypothetical protein